VEEINVDLVIFSHTITQNPIDKCLIKLGGNHFFNFLNIFL
jgi:hypothetical protein